MSAPRYELANQAMVARHGLGHIAALYCRSSTLFGVSLEPPGPLLTRLHTTCMEYPECLPGLLSPLAERTPCFQVARHWATPYRAAMNDGGGAARRRHLAQATVEGAALLPAERAAFEAAGAGPLAPQPALLIVAEAQRVVRAWYSAYLS